MALVCEPLLNNLAKLGMKCYLAVKSHRSMWHLQKLLHNHRCSKWSHALAGCPAAAGAAALAKARHSI